MIGECCWPVHHMTGICVKRIVKMRNEFDSAYGVVTAFSRSSGMLEIYTRKKYFLVEYENLSEITPFVLKKLK